MLLPGVASPLALGRRPATGTASGVRILASVPSFYGSLRVIKTDTHRLLTVDGIGQNYRSLDPAAEPHPYLAFLGEDVPGHLLTRGAFQAVRGRLSPGGLLGINYTTIPGGRDVAALATTLASVFRHVRAFSDGSGTNELATLVLVASDEPIALDGAGDPSAGAQFILANELPLATARGPVLTDDHNPISTFRLGTNRSWRRSLKSYVGGDPALWSDL